MIKVNHVSFSGSGGAGRVAERLFKYQRSLDWYGVEFLKCIDRDLASQPFSIPITTARALIDNYIVKKNTPSLFSLYRNIDNSNLVKLLNLSEGIIHLHWIEGAIGSLTLEKIMTSPRIKIWTIHDMAPLTGGCHYSLGCDRHISGCTNCPIVRPIFKSAVKNKKEIRNRIFKSAQNTVLVFPTKIFYEKFANLVENKNLIVRIIPNPIDDIFFKGTKIFNNQKIVLGFVSTQINNPIKRYEDLKKIILEVSKNTETKIELVAVGGNDFGERIIEMNHNFTIRETGRLISDKELLTNYIKMDLLISISRDESFGLSVAESSGVGVPSLIFGQTSSEELIKIGTNGWIVNDEKDFISRLTYLIRSGILKSQDSKLIKKYAFNNWSIERVSAQYDKVYKSMLDII